MEEVPAHTRFGEVMPIQFRWQYLPPETIGEKTAAERLPVLLSGDEFSFDEALRLAVERYPGWEFGMFVPLLPESVFRPSPQAQEIRIPNGMDK
jgi:hypothetical protein